MVAKRYGTLPSQVLKLGNSIDVRCAILALEHENYLNKKVANNGKDPAPQLSQEEMLAMMEQVRGRKNG